MFDIVAGARPNFMKVAPILRQMERRRLGCQFVHTGQHYDDAMSEAFLRELAIRAPDVHLGVGSGTHGAQTARVLMAFEEHLLRTRCACVVVVGDVNSTMACTLAAAKLGIPVAHVEAGLRSFDRRMPEEINRVVTDAVADLLLVSEPAGLQNLAREGIEPENVAYVGNVMIDTLVAELPAARSATILSDLGLGERSYAYVTLHRPATVDVPDRLAAAVRLLERLSSLLPVIFAIHPRTRSRLEAGGLYERLSGNSRICLLGPQPYRASLRLTASARLVLTDSGGIQEETSYLRVPCITFRSSTERPVTTTAGTNVVVGEDVANAWAAIARALAGQHPTGRAIPGWDGHAAGRIVDELVRRFGRAADAQVPARLQLRRLESPQRAAGPEPAVLPTPERPVSDPESAPPRP